ncbi:hypothetical protein EC957_009279 [Mortierella hygrophila]|uniref:GH16 domain-containing protein n=1 Tax=Mortierella hygrophila TaxID=979708 RepID=A0A9P6FI30_9FUNG|nr:hypothetical protein EC957_009279 [Mortierella hygrophila]
MAPHLIVGRILLLTLLLTRAQSEPAASSLSTTVNLAPLPAPIAPTAAMLKPLEGSCRYHPGGGTCPENAPCCLNGYCSDDPRYCSTGCEPKNSWKESSCFPQAFCSNIHEDFHQPKLASSKTFNGNPYQYDFTTDYNAESVSIQDSKLKISMKLDRIPNSYGRPQGLGSVVSTTRFMQYGKVKARIKTGSSSPGVVSAFIIRNEDPGDEIDFEVVGRDPTEAQTNFYYRTPPDMPTDLIDYSNTGKQPLNTNTALDFHDYEIEWMPEYILWKVDDKVIRHVFRNETKDDVGIDPATDHIRKRYPSSPARIQFGIWDGGQGSEGTAAWAGTPTDWSKPDQKYEIQVDYVDIQCYYPGNETQTWPPAGYGPTKIHDGPYFTPGQDNRSDHDTGDSLYNEQENGVHPYVAFYKNPKLMIPTGCLMGLALVVVGTVEVVRRRRLSKVRWS